MVKFRMKVNLKSEEVFTFKNVSFEAKHIKEVKKNIMVGTFCYLNFDIFHHLQRMVVKL